MTAPRSRISFEYSDDDSGLPSAARAAFVLDRVHDLIGPTLQALPTADAATAQAA